MRRYENTDTYEALGLMLFISGRFMLTCVFLVGAYYVVIDGYSLLHFLTMKLLGG